MPGEVAGLCVYVISINWQRSLTGSNNLTTLGGTKNGIRSESNFHMALQSYKVSRQILWIKSYEKVSMLCTKLIQYISGA